MNEPSSKTVRIGGACGYWGEADMAWGQLLQGGTLDYLVFDYLAEISLSILARQRAADPDRGYVPDFVRNLSHHLPDIARRGVKICSNAGGMNVEACAEAVRAEIRKAGLSLTVSVVTGDDVSGQADQLSGKRDLTSGDVIVAAERTVSANAYLGAFPIAHALNSGADIVITGRCVDSAVTLGALIHEFGWSDDDLDRLAQGSLIGHLLECGPQVTGGNFTDWETVADGLHDIGYPVAEVASDGTAVITKPQGTGGCVTTGTVAEQLLYEIGDPQAYYLPDVICDFSGVMIDDLGQDNVRVSGAKGRGRPSEYKVSVTIEEGYRLSVLLFMTGRRSRDKARIVYESALKRGRRDLADKNWSDYSHTALEITGDGSPFGEAIDADDIAFRISVRHEHAPACSLMLRAILGLGLATPPGLSLFSGGQPRPQPVLRLISILVPKSDVHVRVDGEAFDSPRPTALAPANAVTPSAPREAADTHVPLERLAFLRSGDKGDTANIGVIARDPKYLPYIWDALSEDVIRDHFDHCVDGDITCYYLPGPHAMNIVLERALGGGGMASLRNDAQGKAYGQVLARINIPVPRALLFP